MWGLREGDGQRFVVLEQGSGSVQGWGTGCSGEKKGP